VRTAPPLNPTYAHLRTREPLSRISVGAFLGAEPHQPRYLGTG
jgi:hypothetical protein